MRLNQLLCCLLVAAATVGGAPSESPATADRTEQLATKVMKVLESIFPGRAATVSSFSQSQIQLENSFLLRKVVTLRSEIDNFRITVDEYEELTAQLVDLNDKLSKENMHMRAQLFNIQTGVIIPAPAERHEQNNTDDELRRELREKENDIERLKAEKESNQRLLDLLLLICLSINVCILLFFGWEHFVDFMPSRAVFIRASRTILWAAQWPSMSVCRQRTVDCLNALSNNLSVTYEKVSRTITHLIVIVR